MESDLLTVMEATVNGTLDRTEVKFKPQHAACVIMASDGYPEKYETGFEITVDASVRDSVYVAGAKAEDGSPENRRRHECSASRRPPIPCGKPLMPHIRK